jgi:hypothetical protein
VVGVASLSMRRSLGYGYEGSCVTAKVTLKPIPGRPQQFGRGRQVPVGVGGVDMAKIG